ncbi:hypothetical protein LIER_06532 [Lithospermum erythrorhizon]|uniref:Uncharacterized protein n=1 Tax=Lithospermum erythrorhizon TaxID=34254 RepID=A0AAV3P4W6_LITER
MYMSSFFFGALFGLLDLPGTKPSSRRLIQELEMNHAMLSNLQWNGSTMLVVINLLNPTVESKDHRVIDQLQPPFNFIIGALLFLIVVVDAIVGILRSILVFLMTNNPDGFLIFSLKATKQPLKAIVSSPITMAIVVSWTLLRPSH